jgi:hypothetical protein
MLAVWQMVLTFQHTGVKNEVWFDDFCTCWHHVEVGWITQDPDSTPHVAFPQTWCVQWSCKSHLLRVTSVPVTLPWTGLYPLFSSH